jgi:hypothetical protein
MKRANSARAELRRKVATDYAAFTAAANYPFGYKFTGAEAYRDEPERWTGNDDEYELFGKPDTFPVDDDLDEIDDEDE